MSRHIDRELNQALQQAETEAKEADGTQPHSLPPRDEEPPRRSLGLLITLLVMGGSIVVLVMTNLKGATWAVHVPELVANPEKAAGRHINLQGDLVSGSMLLRQEPCEYRFRLTEAGSDIEVRYAHCTLPDNMRDIKGMKVQVTASGRLAKEGYFQADQVIGKCPGHYDAQKAGGPPPEFVEPKIVD